METINILLQVGLGITSLVCLVMIIADMFSQGSSGLGIASAILVLVCGIGGIIAFIWGWCNSSKKKVMLVWTACIFANIILNFAFGPAYNYE